ncbi:MAG: UPF0182 family protein, partial [Syntrophobacterales bacterium]|nr:UPF0182 family protein [Syntrophobacterales bacterium]
MFDGSQEPIRKPNIASTIIMVVLIAAVACFMEVAWIVTDWLWFQEVGYTGVFWTTFWTKWLLGGVAGLIFFLFFAVNLYFAEYMANKNSAFAVNNLPFPPLRLLNHRNLLSILGVVSAIF